MKLLRILTILPLLASGVLSQQSHTCAIRGHCYKPFTHWLLCVDDGPARAGELSPAADAIMKKRCPEMYSGSTFRLFFVIDDQILNLFSFHSQMKKLPFVARLIKF